jgi:hypothetical protein
MSEHLDLLSLDAARTGPRPAHLDACAECRATFDTLRSLEIRLAPPNIEVPALVRARVLRPRRRWMPFAAAAAIFLAVASLWMSRNPHDLDGSGRVDIVDAYLLASGLKDGDVNGDGLVDQKDVEALAREAVTIGGGEAR